MGVLGGSAFSYGRGTSVTLLSRQVLGVPKGAGDAQIKSAYRKLAIQYHPDKTAGDEELEQKFKEVSAAYSVCCPTLESSCGQI